MNLKTVLLNDEIRGWNEMTVEQVAADMSIVDVDRARETTDGPALFNVIDEAEYQSLDAARKTAVDQLLDTANRNGSINVAGGTRARQTIEDVGPKTAVALVLSLAYKISRAKAEGLYGKVRVGHIERVRGFRYPPPLKADYRKGGE